MEWNGNGKGMESNDIARGMLPLENFDFLVNSTRNRSHPIPFHSMEFHFPFQNADLWGGVGLKGKRERRAGGDAYSRENNKDTRLSNLKSTYLCTNSWAIYSRNEFLPNEIFFCSRNECSQNEFLFLLTIPKLTKRVFPKFHETRFHETSFFFSHETSTHDTSVHETTFTKISRNEI